MMFVQSGRFAGGGGGGDPHWGSVMLLCGFDGADGSTTMTDESLAGHTLSVFGNAQLDTGVAPPFGTSSLLLDGSGDDVFAADSADWAFGSGDFTIELFARPRINNLNRGLISQYASSGSQLAWEIYCSNDDLSCRVSANGTTATVFTTTSDAFTAAAWHHVCFERASTKLRIYIDGVMRGSTTSFGSNSVFDSNLNMTIGGRDDSDKFDGHIKEVRITKGVARYNNDAGFTAPTAAFPRS
ncbi:MAG: LamG domain-containing protein [Mesorhizobium sp.]|uniref:LamG domain-containing protein n=1 Tax=Mesorhizobium sp. TaxID=1871066 RepID=UPI0011F9EE16|nr:LamG domain-containing protein [Mesorhizobium sp.]TIL85172.1 MAG: LamG domain-containing protein [Mesorhizobium sp.]